MVCSKRVISALLALCALSALCAVGASASYPSSSYSCGYYSSSAYVVLEQKNSLPCSFNWQEVSRSLGFSVSSSYSEYIDFSVTFYITWRKANISSTLSDYLNSLTVIYSDSDPISSISSFSSCSLISTQAEFIGNSNNPNSGYYNITCLYSAQVSSLSDSGTYFFRFPSFSGSGYDYLGDLKSVSITPSSPPEPEPEPDPDEYNPIPDVYTSLTPSLYFTNYKSTGENSFAYLNRSFSEFPSPDYAWTTQFPDVILGAFYNDFSSHLEPLDSIAGQASVVFTDPLGVFTDFSLISSLSSYGVVPFSDVEIWLVNGSEPTLSGFQYFVCPSSWISTKLWRYPISQYSTEYVCNFQINLPEDYIQTVGFTPVNFFVRIYRSTAGSQGVGRPYDVWYDVTNFVIGVYDRPSSDPDDIPPVPYNPSFSDPSNPGQEVTNALDEEERRVSESYNPDESMDSANSTFDLSALGSAFSRLADGIGYTGTSFSFKFPASGTVPFLNVSLWNETEIPFKQWIDALPVALLYVVRFLAWLGLGFSFAHMIRKLISDLNGGDKD